MWMPIRPVPKRIHRLELIDKRALGYQLQSVLGGSAIFEPRSMDGSRGIVVCVACQGQQKCKSSIFLKTLQMGGLWVPRLRLCSRSSSLGSMIRLLPWGFGHDGDMAVNPRIVVKVDDMLGRRINSTVFSPF